MEEKKRRYGPQPMSADLKRTITVTTWLNREERERLDILCKATRMRRGELLRTAALSFGWEVRKPVIPEINVKAWVDLSRVGSNLNQIAKHLNQGKMVGTGEIQRVLKEVHQELKEVRLSLLGAKSESQD
jgi:hypothetical protein